MFTVFYDGQFWVGVAERERDGVLEVARIVFGPSEPRDFEVMAFARDQFARLTFRATHVQAATTAALPKNPKRREREAMRAQADAPISTRAQAALAAAHEAAAADRAASARERRADQRQRRWEEKRALRKKRRRGH